MKKRKHKGENNPMLFQFFLLFTFFFCMLIYGGMMIQKIQIETVLEESSQYVVQTVESSETYEQSDKKRIALTFDDGPHKTLTPQLLEGLKKRGVKASFFVLGESAKENPDIIKQMYEDGHLIGNHTYHHVQLTKNNRDKFLNELKQTNTVIEEITGKSVEYVRPPYGSWDKSFEETLNMIPVLWNIDPLDWCNGDVSCVTEKVISKAEDNAVILLHDTFPTSVTAALKIVDILQDKGYEFVTVDQFLFD